jgi:hypothetical protein
MQFNKKTILALCIGFYGATSTFAQQKNVVSAINYLGYYNKDKDANDLIEAKNILIWPQLMLKLVQKLRLGLTEQKST